MNHVIIENIETNCIYDTTYLVPLAKLPRFTAINNCLIDHIIGADLLSPDEKLYYLVNDFYKQSFKSWHSNKKLLSNSNYSRDITFSANKIGALLGLSKSKIFNIQRKLEALEYLHINRSLNKFGMNNINVPIVTLPKVILSSLIAASKSKSLLNLDIEDITLEERRDILSNSKHFIPLNFDLFRFVFFHKDISSNSKILYLKLFSIIHKIKLKNKYPIYAGGVETDNLLKECNISRSTLYRSLKQLQDNGLISLEKIRVESDAACSNRFDKLINYIQILVPKELEHVFLTNSQNNEENEVQSRVSKIDPTCVKIIPSYTYNLKKKNIIKIRSMKSNFKENYLEEKEEVTLEKKEEITVETNSKEIPPKKEQVFFTKPKKLAEFYPLSAEDGNKLQSASGREFSLHAMNEILKSLSNKLQNHLFNSRKSFMNYMAKTFKYELRDAVKVSNETFRIRANFMEEDVIEKYLTEIENTREVTPEWHLKKKLACVLSPIKSYELLRNYRGIRVGEGKALIELRSRVELTRNEKEIIKSQVKATHEKLDMQGEYMPIENLEFIILGDEMTEKQSSNIKQKNQQYQDQQYSENNQQLRTDLRAELRTGIWGNVRSKIAEIMGQNGEMIDKSWFSKLEAEIDEEEKQIKLKAPSEFFRREIEERYKTEIELGANKCGFRIRNIYC